MFVLTKFFQEYQYRKEFIEGNLYLSSMSTYTRTYPEKIAFAHSDQEDKVLKSQLNDEQQDIFEGTIAGFNKNELSWLPENLKRYTGSDVKARTIGYNYSNLMCFCKMNYEYYQKDGRNIIKWQEPEMHSFGEYAIIVKNQKELIKRIVNSIRKKNYRYLFGPVHYYPMMDDGRKVISGNMIHLCRDDPVDIKDILKQTSHKKYDAFDKWDKFKNQSEWRLIIDKNKEVDNFLRINVGDLSDIVEAVYVRDLAEKINQLFMQGEITPSQNGYIGNVTRTEMRDEFYRKGNYKANYMITIGSFIYADE